MSHTPKYILEWLLRLAYDLESGHEILVEDHLDIPDVGMFWLCPDDSRQ